MGEDNNSSLNSNSWQEDQNVSNHLFRLRGDILDKPGIIAANWSDDGDLIKEEIWSFDKLQKRATKCIHYLQNNGLKKGDRVLLMVRPGLELIVICFALFRIGCIPIVIDPGMGLRKFRRAVEHSTPDVLIGIPVAGWVRRFFPGSFKSIRRSIIVKKWFFSEIEKLDTLAPVKLEPIKGTDMAAILFTSGSTGAPKGVCYEHDMLNAQIRLLKNYLKIQPGEVDLPMLPIFALFNPAMGMTTVIPEINPSRPASVNPAKIVAAIKRYNVTNSFGSPVLWRKIGDYCDQHEIKLNSLKRILVAGAAAPTSLYRQYQNLLTNGSMYSPYGATECLPVSIVKDELVLSETADQSDLGKGICVGKPLDEVSVKIISTNCEDLDELPKYEIGEILVTGPSVTKQYDRLPEVNEASKINLNGTIWHRMGDMGYLDENGKLWFCGRKVESVDSTFFTECVEGLFVTHPIVRRCAMIKWEGKGNTNNLALVVEPEFDCWTKDKETLNRFAKELIQHLLEKGVSCPLNAFFFNKSLPVDVRHNAKIHRLTLSEYYSTKEPIIIELT